MAIQTRQVTVTINDFDGNLVENARVNIRLRGLGNSPNGAVAPADVEKLTDENGQCVFTLWENNQLYSDTYYEVTSFHPDGQQIHRRETFRVYDSDANLAELIAGGLVAIDPTQALADQIAADRSAAASSASDAEGHANDAEAAQAAAEAARDMALSYRDTAENHKDSAASYASFASSSEMAIQGLVYQAEGHRDSAQVSAGTATIQAGIATTKAGEASSSASAAGTSEANAAGSASTATTQAGIATTRANTATAQAGIATTAAGTATTQAGIATTKAGEASASANAASASEGNAANSASAASTSEANALQYSNDAQSARDDAIAAVALVNNIYNGDGAPAGALGDEGDYYIDNLSFELYGPKTGGSWGSPTPLIGPPGEQGPQGIPGDTGLTLPGTTTSGYLATWSGTGGDAMGQLDPATFATAAQGSKADTAVQPGALATLATAAQGTKADTAHGWGNHANAGYATGDNFNASGNYANLRARGTTKADVGLSNVQNINFQWSWGDELTHIWGSDGSSSESNVYNAAAVRTFLGLHAVATSGNYNNLSNRPSLGTAASRAVVTGPGDATGNSLVDNARLAAVLEDVGGGGYELVNLGTVGAGGAETINLNLAGAEGKNLIFVMEYADAVGNITINPINTPAASTMWSIHIAIRRPGRKSLITPAGWNWANGAVPSFQNSATYYGLINIQHQPFMPQANAVMGFILNSGWT